MKNNIIFLGVLMLILMGCKNEEKIQIESQLNKLYSVQQTIYDPQNYEMSLFSNQLGEKIENERKLMSEKVEKIKKSDSPLDKAEGGIEGSAFSSSYDGFSSFKIKEINIKGNTAEATVDFEYKYDKVVDKWSDKVLLVNEKGWKIDNVIFSKSDAGVKDLYEKLDKAK